MVNVYSKDGSVSNNYNAVSKAFKKGGVSVAISCDEDLMTVSDVLYDMVKVDVGGFVFAHDDDGVGVGQLVDDAFSGRLKLKNKIITVILDKKWSDVDRDKFKKLCANASRFGCMIIVGNVEKTLLGGYTDFVVGGSDTIFDNVSVVSSSGSSNRLLSGNGSSGRLSSGRSGGSLFDRYRGK